MAADAQRYSNGCGQRGTALDPSVRQCFRRHRASGVPTLGQLLKNWLKIQSLSSVQVQASLLLPYFDFEGVADDDTGVHAESRNFQLNTDAALQYLRTSGKACFDRVFLVGSDIKARYGFSIGGTSQTNAAHLVELLAALGVAIPSPAPRATPMY